MALLLLEGEMGGRPEPGAPSTDSSQLQPSWEWAPAERTVFGICYSTQTPSTGPARGEEVKPS